MFEEKADIHGIYGYSHASTIVNKPKGCVDCEYDKTTKTNGEYITCQRAGGGKDDMTCYTKRTCTRGGVALAHIESSGKRRGRPRGGAGLGSNKFFEGKSILSISGECGVKVTTLLTRLSNNHSITLEELTRPARSKMGPKRKK